MATQVATYANGTTDGTASPPKVEAPRRLPQPPPRNNTAEYDLLLGRLLRQVEETGSASFVGFTSCRRRAGVSTVAANVAIRAADLHSGPVLLVEANTTRPRQRQRFRLRRGPGLVDVLCTQLTLDSAAAETRVPGLSLLFPGRGSSQAPVAVTRDAVEQFVQELREHYVLVVFDFPSGDALSSWTPLVQEMDSLLLVVDSEKTTRREIQDLQRQCTVDNVAVTGAVLNRYRTYTPWFLRRRG